jgi:hypothetical protein
LENTNTENEPGPSNITPHIEDDYLEDLRIDPSLLLESTNNSSSSSLDTPFITTTSLEILIRDGITLSPLENALNPQSRPYATSVSIYKSNIGTHFSTLFNQIRSVENDQYPCISSWIKAMAIEIFQ